ncbi:AAA family ATPase [Pseudorhodoferax soli]|uniref:ABC-type lipoprotein export system ATPase subunit n=1 Tax=Pseudorhodoferax soli TaxID=545864 RepID=A0A368XSF7_9BURK|nr:AAA family ATPase [Pseudorhodoferax soli]RCW70106.1 ABC-type lipoprotein export system ATPase subunit [Pseudorhodoferax soli]
MTYLLSLPNAGEPNNIQLNAGESIFLLGANGAGKSSLMHHFYLQHHGNAERITAHRQMWFQNAAVGISPAERVNIDTSLRQSDININSRYRDDYAPYRSNIGVSDLMAEENRRARAITELLTRGDLDAISKETAKSSPVARINNLFSVANLPISVAIDGRDNLVARRATTGAEYSIQQLSDGERNALIIAAMVLSAKPGRLILIDEPERHLHRSIIAPFLSMLLAERNDCAFVVSTHDLHLPLDTSATKTLLVRGCSYSGEHPVRWEADLFLPGEALDRQIQEDILGARKKILFIEGDEVGSMDLALYSVLFPGFSVVAKRRCKDVIQATKGITQSEELHWINAHGLIDGDSRSADEIQSLNQDKVHTLPLYSVESVYYHSTIIFAIAEKMSQILPGDAQLMGRKAISAALDVLKQSAAGLAERSAERALRNEWERNAPTMNDVRAGVPFERRLNVEQVVEQHKLLLNEFVQNRDWDGICGRFNIKKSGIKKTIANALGFTDSKHYEAAAIKILNADDGMLARTQALVGGVPA